MDSIVGYTDGVYDMFHVGHLNMIREAKKRCDYLIVGVHGDKVVEEYKMKKTVIQEQERAEIIGAIRYVDKVVINHFRDKIKLYELYKFNKVFIGDDWKGTDRWNTIEKQLSVYGIIVEYIPYTNGVSTTEIRRKLSGDFQI